jgi:hypothetical protein
MEGGGVNAKVMEARKILAQLLDAEHPKS